MSNHQDRAQLFKQAVLYVADQAGAEAVTQAFGDPAPLDAAWDLPLPEFKRVLRERVREGLKAEKGDAA